jgi:uncharacterized protein YggE
MRAYLIALMACVVLIAACGDGGSTTTNTDAGLATAAAVGESSAQPSDSDVAAQATSQEPIPVQEPEPVDVGVRSITVGGIGSEYAEPDRAFVDVGVTSRRPTVIAASEAAAAAGTAMTETLLAAGIESQDIQSTEFSIFPYHENYPIVAGFETNIGYRVAIPSVDIIGQVLADAIAAGGDDARAWGVRFEVDPTGLIDTARARAWADVESRAESLAALAGEPLGELLDAHEKVLLSSSQGIREGGEGDAAAFDIPVAPGVSGVIVLLTVTFAIGD